MKKSEKIRMASYERSTTWLQFYIYFRFPLGFVFGGINLLTLIVSPFLYQTEFSSFLFTICTAFYIFSIWVFCKLDNLEPTGYKSLQAFLPAEVLYVSLFSDLWYEAIFKFVLLSLVWWLPNAIYFKKRKSLFYEEPPVVRYSEKYGLKENNNKPNDNKNFFAVEQSKIQDQAPPENIGASINESKNFIENELIICKKCGEKLPINAIFCNKCGKKVCKKERKPLTKRKKIILFAGGLLLCICAITGSGIIGYEIGSKSGYDEGFISGRDYGWSEGHVRGYKKGLTEGRQEMINKNDDTYWKNRAQYILEKNEEENLENTSKITNDPKRQAILDKSQTTNKNQIRKCATSGCDEILTSSKNFCSLHKCKYNSCENERYLDCEYCRRHKCRDALCYEPRANDHTEYCTLHKCHVQNCNLRASYDSLYCITHTN